MPISVNMFGLRLTSEVQKRWKKGAPPQSTTGVARANSSQGRIELQGKNRSPTMTNAPMKACGQNMVPMAMASRGAVRARLTQKRRVMSRSSGFSSCAAVTVRGSSAMPQIGHEPGPGRTTSGCMGQVYSMRADGAAGTSGSSAIPQEGQAPGLGSRTSGHMGQT